MTKAPPLVEILKALGRHHWELWDKNYGKLEKSDKLEPLLQEALQSFERNQSRLAGTAFTRLVVASGRRLNQEEEKELRRCVAAAIRMRRNAKRESRSDLIPTIEDLGPIVAKACRQLQRLQSYRPSKEADDAYHAHPLRKVCQWVEENTGISREQVECAARRLNTEIGLREWKRQSLAPWPDCLWMVEKFNALDASGKTRQLWEKLRRDDGQLLEIGLLKHHETGTDGHAAKVVQNQQPSAHGKDHNSNDSRSVPSLSERQYSILQALMELTATSAELRRSTADLASAAEGKGSDPEGFKNPIADLKRRGLLHTKEGRGGGCWLTETGIASVELIRANRKKL